MLDLVDLDDPVLEAHRSYLRARSTAEAAALAERQSLADLKGLVGQLEWIDPEILWFLYWHTNVPVETFAPLVGVRVGLVGSELQPGLERECDCCHESSPMPNRQAIRAGGFTCGVCLAHRRESQAAWVRRNQAERDKTQERFAELAAMPYQEYLQSPEWQERRQIMYKRAGYRCQVCSDKSRILDVHHNTYANRGNEDAKDLVVLCRKCHARFHGKPE